jgi:hypothetical protein
LRIKKKTHDKVDGDTFPAEAPASTDAVGKRQKEAEGSASVHRRRGWAITDR